MEQKENNYHLYFMIFILLTAFIIVSYTLVKSQEQVTNYKIQVDSMCYSDIDKTDIINEFVDIMNTEYDLNLTKLRYYCPIVE